MEAGNRCFDPRVPEEINRKIVDHLADINMTITEHARKYLLSEGVKPETIIKIGSSMKEIFHEYQTKIDDSEVLNKLSLVKKKYFVLSAHREENIDSINNFNDFVDTINSISNYYKLPIIFSTHPRTLKKIEQKNISFKENIKIMKPLCFTDYIKLQKEAFCVISDSGTITEESSILKFPAITIRNAHERPEGMDYGTLIMSGLCRNNVIDSINIVTDQYKCDFTPDIVPDYNDLNVSKKVVRIIQSYVQYIKRTVWSEF